MNLKSTVNTQGKYVTQILHCALSGEKRTFHGIDTSTIKQGEFTKFKTKDGRLIMVNTKNTWIVEVFKEDEAPYKRKAGDQVIYKAKRGKEFVDIIALSGGMYHIVSGTVDHRVEEQFLEEVNYGEGKKKKAKKSQ